MSPARKTFSRHAVIRRGASAVEMALTMPVFVMFLAGLMEFGHVFLVHHSLNAAAKRGARYGVTEGVTTDQVEERVKSIVAKTLNAGEASVLVRDAAVFDSSNMDPATIDYNALPPIELSSADDGDLFVVQIKVPYDNVALLPPFWFKGRTVTGQSVVRHE